MDARTRTTYPLNLFNYTPTQYLSNHTLSIYLTTHPLSLPDHTSSRLVFISGGTRDTLRDTNPSLQRQHSRKR